MTVQPPARRSSYLHLPPGVTERTAIRKAWTSKLDKSCLHTDILAFCVLSCCNGVMWCVSQSTVSRSFGIPDSQSAAYLFTLTPGTLYEIEIVKKEDMELRYNNYSRKCFKQSSKFVNLEVAYPYLSRPSADADCPP
jgi:hypothetical protein